jgi:hypothetical protein
MYELRILIIVDSLRFLKSKYLKSDHYLGKKLIF